MQRFSIGEFARAADVSVDTIRFYEKSGLLPQPFRRPSGVREYSDVDLSQLQFVRRARAVGFSLNEVGQLVASLADEGGPDRVSAAIARRLSLLDSKIAQLTQWREELRALQSAPPREVGTAPPNRLYGDESGARLRGKRASISPLSKDSHR